MTHFNPGILDADQEAQAIESDEGFIETTNNSTRSFASRSKRLS